jgi:hypothetical protein
MLEVKIHLVPYGKQDWKRIIGSITIVNNGTGTRELGNYKYVIEDRDVKIEGELKKYNRNQSVFFLLKEILNKAVV